MRTLDLYMPYPFSKAEYKERLNRARAEMRRKKIDVLLLSSPESIYYMSGYALEWYKAQSPKRWMATDYIGIEVDHDDFIFFADVFERHVIETTTVTTDARYPPSDRTEVPGWLAKELKREGWLPGTVGLEMWSYVPNRAVSEMIQKELEKEGGQIVDGSDIIRDLRWIKSPQEIAYVEEAARIADIGMKAAIETMRPGMTELEVYGEMFYAMTKAGGENPALPILVRAGERSGHTLASRRKINQGERVAIDVCGVYNRYHADVERTFWMGTPPTEIAKRAEIITKWWDIVSEIIRPNLSPAELMERSRTYFGEAGITPGWGGYELGQSFPPDWCGPYLYDLIDPGDRLFVPGTVVNFETLCNPNMINTIVFYKDRARILSEIPSELIII